MSITTPPGWYPDPDRAHRPNSRAGERWWDGSAWSGQTRSRGAVRGPKVAGVVGGLVLAASLLVGSLLVLLGAGTGFGDATRDGAGGAPEGEPDRNSEIPATGVDLPVLEGWEHDPIAPMVSTGEYNCPGSQGEGCLRGSSVIVVAGSDNAGHPEEAARSDIGRFAKLAYSKGTYGGITAHKSVVSEKTEVAGQEGYRVRWKIVNRTKPDAYVESVAFLHPDGSGQMLLLRSGFDIHASAPPVGDMDKLAEGVTEDDGASAPRTNVKAQR